MANRNTEATEVTEHMRLNHQNAGIGTHTTPTLELNPGAEIFMPNNQMEPSVQDYAKLSPIQEERHEELEDDVKSFTFPDINMCGAEWKPQSLPSSKEILRYNNVVFISAKTTQWWVKKQLFSEKFKTDRDLYYYLRYQTRMQVVDALYKVFRCAGSEQELVIFNAELHESETQSRLFIIGDRNDKKHSMKWKMITFMTPLHISKVFNINTSYLPCGSRCPFYRKIERQISMFNNDMNIFRCCLNMNKMNKLIKMEQIKADQKRVPYIRPLFVTPRQLFECIKASIGHKKNQLIPTIWFNKDKQNPIYRIQMLLPIEIESHWFAISFDYDDKQQLIPVKICIDAVDIRRKLSLFDPSIDPNQYSWFSNEITEINIVNEHIHNLFLLQHEEIHYWKKKADDLMQQNREKDEEMKRLTNGDNVFKK